MSAERERLAAILAADAVGYSRLMASDQRKTIALLDSCRLVFRKEVEAHRGRVVDTAGDSVLAVFDSAATAVQAALAIQKELETSACELRYRLGVHLGDVLEKTDGTVYGDGVNVADRRSIARSRPDLGRPHHDLADVGVGFHARFRGRQVLEVVDAVDHGLELSRNE